MVFAVLISILSVNFTSEQSCVLYAGITRAEKALFLQEQGKLLLNRGDWAGGIKKFEKAYSLNPSSYQLKKLLYRVYLQRGVQQQKRSLPAAIDFFKKAQRMMPESHQVKWNLAQCAIKEKRYLDALNLLSEVNRIMGDKPVYLKLCGNLAYKLQFMDSAMTYFEKLKRYGSRDDYYPYLALARIHYQEGNHFEARESLVEAIKRAPANKKVRELFSRLESEGQFEPGLLKKSSINFEIHFSPSLSADKVDRILLLGENLFIEYAAVFGNAPNRQIQLYIYDESSFNQIKNGYEMAVGLFDGKIRILFQPGDDWSNKFNKTLRHELVHLFIDSLAGNKCPRWLNEGIAQFFEGRPRAGERELAAAMKFLAGQSILDFLNEYKMADSSNRMKSFYILSHFLVGELLETTSQALLKDLFAELNRDIPVVRAIEKVFKIDWQTLRMRILERSRSYMSYLEANHR